MGVRTFIAIELPQACVDRLRPAIEGLRHVPAVRVSQPDGIHLTLHFLGNVEVASVEELAEGLARVVQGRRPFRLLLRGIGAFPSMSRPQVFFAEVTGPDLAHLIDLQHALRPVLQQRGLPVERRPYRPHLTLARARRRLSAAEHQSVEAWGRDFHAADLASLDVHKIALMRSELSSGTPRYTTLRTFPLARPDDIAPGEKGMRPGGFEPPHPGP